MESELIKSEKDDDGAVIDEWPRASHSSNSNALSEEFVSKPFSELLDSENQTLGISTKIKEGVTGVISSKDLYMHPKNYGAPSSLVGGLSDRMAAKTGFNLPKIDTARIPPNSIVPSTDIHSPYFTIPLGLSPTMLLESPVFLSQPLGQSSPTTGKFHFSENIALNPLSVIYAKSEADLFEEMPEEFAFKPPRESHSYLSSCEKKMQLPNKQLSGNIAVGNKNFQNLQDFHLQACSSLLVDRNDTVVNAMLSQKMCEPFLASDHFPARNDQMDGAANPRGELAVAVGTPADDGYNWRKYGQKQVKGSKFPRSYYKCTHPSCQVKKKVECSHEGLITEIIYKGSHVHSQPNMSERPGVPSSHQANVPQYGGSEESDSQSSYDVKPKKGSSQSGNGGQDFLQDGLEASSSAPAAEYCKPTDSMSENQEGAHLSPDVNGVSSTTSNNEEEDDQATHGSVSLGCDGEGDESGSKKRKLDACAIEMSAASRAVHEPRIVVQTTSEVDILDDGYRWRKYGQKVVKGNPNPRSYYKCTNPGCTVRKHIERASHDLKSVITTYEGKHNHDIPAARGSNHPNSAPSSAASNSVPQPHNLLQIPEPTQDTFMRLEGHSPLRTLSFSGRDQLGRTVSFPFAMAPPGLPNLSMVGLAPMAATKMPILPPIHPHLSHHQLAEAGLLLPKLEDKEEAVPNAASVYHQMIRLPLGPHPSCE